MLNGRYTFVMMIILHILPTNSIVRAARVSPYVFCWCLFFSSVQDLRSLSPDHWETLRHDRKWVKFLKARSKIWGSSPQKNFVAKKHAFWQDICEWYIWYAVWVSWCICMSELVLLVCVESKGDGVGVTSWERHAGLNGNVFCFCLPSVCRNFASRKMPKIPPNRMWKAWELPVRNSHCYIVT